MLQSLLRGGAIVRESSTHTFMRAVFLLALMLAGCPAQLVFDPQQPIAPNINDQSAPDLELRIFYDAARFDAVVKPKGVFSYSPNRCIHVSNPFSVTLTGWDFEGGISYLGVGSIDVAPMAGTIVATPPPDSPTQADDPSSPNVTYPNPGMSPGSHTAEVKYYIGGAQGGRPRGLASLQVRFDLGGRSVAHISSRAVNTSVSASTGRIEGIFVRPADSAHAPGSACAPP